MRILTVGHSNHTIEKFLKLLAAHGVEQLVDVRSMPKSRHNPQFNSEELERSLHDSGIGYVHMPALGGLRRPRKDSINTGWKNSSFRGYADYMQTPAFEVSLDELVAAAAKSTTTIMCAEAVPWRCHRSLIGDALIARDIQVEDILSEVSRKPHVLTPFVRVENGKVTYPGLF